MLDQPLYKKLADELRDRILNGDLKPNTKFPSQKELAEQNDVSVVTIQKALSVLVDEGLIYRVRKRGTFVKDASGDRGRSLNLPFEKICFAFNNVPIEIFSSDLHLKCMQGMREVAEANGLEFNLLNLRDSWKIPDESNTGLILWGFAGPRDKYPGLGLLNAVERWKEKKVPLVVLHQYFSQLHVRRINGDNIKGAFLATKHLLSLRHKRIGIILSGASEVELNPEFVLRLQGYRMALQGEGVPFDSDLLSVKDGEDEDSGYVGFRELMNLPNPPTAVFAGTDVKAVGAFHAAADMGIRIPDDVSIIGYDGNTFGASVVPQLTTIDQDFYSMGRKSVEMLLRGTTEESAEVLVPPKLCVRKSTKVRDVETMDDHSTEMSE